MTTELMLSGNNNALALPAHLQGAGLNVSQGLLATAGVGGNRIGLKGNRFRQVVNGKEEWVFEENFLDVIILGAVPAISRIYYEGAYVQDEKASPTCYSADGIAPPDDVKQKQSSKCEICPQNQKGSKIVNGQKIKACGYFQRLIVMLAGDMEGVTYQLDVKSMGIFGESLPEVNKFNIRDYTKLLSNRGADVATLVTRLTFDPNSSVPKLLFSPARFIEADEFEVVKSKVASDEVANMLKISMSTIDIAGEVDMTVVTEATASKATAALPEPKAEMPGAPAPKAQPTMTDKAGANTYEQFVAEGWSDEDMVAEGYATFPAPPKAVAPPPPPKPQTPAPPTRPATQAPAKPAPAAAPAGQRRAPGRPAGSTNKPPVQQAAAAPTPAAVPAAAPRPPVPGVTKAHPIPSAPDTAVRETTTNDEVNDILANLL